MPVTELETSISRYFCNAAAMLQKFQQLMGRSKAVLKGENKCAERKPSPNCRLQYSLVYNTSDYNTITVILLKNRRHGSVFVVETLFGHICSHCIELIME